MEEKIKKVLAVLMLGAALLLTFSGATLIKAKNEARETCINQCEFKGAVCNSYRLIPTFNGIKINYTCSYGQHTIDLTKLNLNFSNTRVECIDGFYNYYGELE